MKEARISYANESFDGAFLKYFRRDFLEISHTDFAFLFALKLHFSWFWCSESELESELVSRMARSGWAFFFAILRW